MAIELLNLECESTCEDIVDLRRLVYGIKNYVLEESDQDALHFGIRNFGELVAACRLSIFPNLSESYIWPGIDHLDVGGIEQPMAYFSRLIVNVSDRKNGFAESLDKHRVRHARVLDIRTLIAMPISENRKLALARLGFVELGLAKPLLHTLYGADVIRPVTMVNVLRNHE